MVLQFILGFLTSFVAATPPGLLNLTSLKISLEKGRRKSYHFAFGVTFIIFIQTYISLVFINYLHNTSFVGTSFQQIAVILFAFLSMFFLYKGIKEKKTQKIKKSKVKNSFTLGIILSSVNLLAIPYYCSVGSALKSNGWMDLTQINILIFVLGSGIGTFSLLSIYNNSARLIQKKMGIISRNINFVLAGITCLIALITLIQLLS